VKLRIALLRYSFPRAVLLVLVWASVSAALDPHRTLTQYSRTVWAQQDGLPQDTIKAIVQTADGYLWLGTDEGLARFDGYEFAVFNKANSDLVSNSITALAATADGSLWIGTSSGLAQYRDRKFRTFTTRSGLPDNAITMLYADHAGVLWIVAGVSLSRYQHGQFTNFLPGRDIPVTSVRTVAEDLHHDLWIAGYTRLVRLSGGQFVPEGNASTLIGDTVLGMIADRHDNLWIAGSLGLIERSPLGDIRKFDAHNGLPDSFVRAVWEDRDGNIWAGTNGGIARLEGERFVSPAGGGSDLDLVRCLFEDREGDLWVGAANGLSRLRDDVFAVYGRTEGLPSDEPNTVLQDRNGRIWVGFHDSGLMLFGKNGYRVFTARDGLPGNEIFAIRETPSGDLLICSRGGVTRMYQDRFSNYTPPEPLGRRVGFDALEDPAGRLWLATPGGLRLRDGGEDRVVVAGGPLGIDAVVTLSAGVDGAVWAGTSGKGLWRIRGTDTRQYTTANGLSSDQIRSLYQDPDDTLWIGTFGGGLNALRAGKFEHFTERHGLLSDNIVHITDDGESLWLSTTRGISRVPKRQLREFTSGARRVLEPVNYGVEDGLRSAQCSPGYPTSGGSQHAIDGRLWFTTSRGLAVVDPRAPIPATLAPMVHLVEMTASAAAVDLAHAARLAPGSERIQIRYTGIHLRAPERVRYDYKLDGLDPDWVHAGNRRVINYNSLRHGQYKFTVRAELLGGPASERSYAFELLPHFYETAWFRLVGAVLLIAGAWATFRLRVRQIRSRFALVLEERARLAREIHDTLAQGFVGISSQLDAVAMCMPNDRSPARQYLDLARRMARHSLTEARRSVMDLRASVLEGQDLAAALESGTRMWTAGSGVDVAVDVSGPQAALPQDFEQHLLRIAQEAVTNVLKHASASRVAVKLHTEARKIYLRIVDNGHGFEQRDVFSSGGGHFGLIGMRERAERLGGELHLMSHPGHGTEVEVTVPLP